MTPARGDGVIEVSSEGAAANGDPAAIAAAWESAHVGRGKTYSARLRSDPTTTVGRRSYTAVYAGAGVYCKIVFIAAPDRGVIVTGVFAIPNFIAGELAFDRMLRTATLGR